MSALADRLKSIELLLEAARKAILKPGPRCDHLEQASKELKLVKILYRSALEGLRLWPGTWYESNLYNRLGCVQEAIADYHNGHGWNCLDRALDGIREAMDRVAEEATAR